MTRRLFAVLLSGVLVVGGLGAAPASADHVEVPDEEDANIVDPIGDGNYHSTFTGASGPVTFLAADIYLVWFTHDADNLYTHIQTLGRPQAESLLYRVWVDPTGDGDSCMAIQAVSEGEFNEAQSSLRLVNDCGDGTEDIGEFIQEDGPPLEGEDNPSGIHTIVIPRDAHEAFADGNTLATPEADTSHNIPGVVRGVPIIDDTEVGTDYEIKAPRRDCSKIKNKKRRQRCNRQQRQQEQQENQDQMAPGVQPNDVSTGRGPLFAI